MPTPIGMLESHRGAVALIAGLITVGIVPTAAVAAPDGGLTTSSSTTSTTTTTVAPHLPPPPAPFTLPIDLGIQLVQQRTQATQDLERLGAALPRDRAREQVVRRDWTFLQRRLARLIARVRVTQHNLDLAHDDLEAAAVDAYMNAGSSRLEAAITAITSASSAMEAGRTMHLIGSFSDQQSELIDQYLSLQKRLRRERALVTKKRDEANAELASAKHQVVADRQGIAHARVRLTVTVVGILAFQKAATSATSPILGPSALTAKQLADFVRASGHEPRITVSIDELAQDYITEGENAGVRGDVAFAQSILETYWFTFPGGGQLAGRDNNFAGIGACDSCKHGFRFADADTGVRAQMQALRIYVDPDLTDATLKQPLVMPKMLNLGFRGKVQTWWDLWGTWATGAFYGQRVYDIYERMVQFAATDPTPAPSPTPAHAPAPAHRSRKSGK